MMYSVSSLCVGQSAYILRVEGASAQKRNSNPLRLSHSFHLCHFLFLFFYLYRFSVRSLSLLTSSSLLFHRSSRMPARQPIHDGRYSAHAYLQTYCDYNDAVCEPRVCMTGNKVAAVGWHLILLFFETRATDDSCVNACVHLSVSTSTVSALRSPSTGFLLHK